MEFSQLNGYKVKDKKAIRFYDNVESMKNDSTLKENMVVKTSGYYLTNDGGCAEYIIVNDSTLTADGGSVHALSNGLYAKLIEEKILNSKQYGAKVDNETDDTIPIQNMINNYKGVINDLNSKHNADINKDTILLSKLYYTLNNGGVRK